MLLCRAGLSAFTLLTGAALGYKVTLYKSRVLTLTTFARSLWLFLAASLVWGGVFATTAPKDITVLADEHYPPYAFRDAKGELTGLTIDLWRLWEKKTGVRVHIIATDWAEAQKIGRAHV